MSMKISIKIRSAFKRFCQFLSFGIHRIFFCKKRGILFHELQGEDAYKRLPDGIAVKFSKGISGNSKFSAGIKVGFITDATKIKLRVLYKKRRVLAHMSTKAASGLDIYVKYDTASRWITCMSPVSDICMLAEETLALDPGQKQIDLFLPPFAQIASIKIGIRKEHTFVPVPASPENAILIYGSSITQGCAASRPSLSYSNLLARKLNRTVINMGFSESAKGEEELIQYLSALRPEVCIMEYDHNVSADELRRTHKKVYSIFRQGNKASLIIMMSRFSGGLSISHSEEQERIDIIKETFAFAQNNGDRNVEMIYGDTLFRDNKEDYFVDDKHPNDLGMTAIAEAICSIMDKRGLDKENESIA